MEASDILLSQKTQLFFRVDGEVHPQGTCPSFISELHRLLPRLGKRSNTKAERSTWRR